MRENLGVVATEFPQVLDGLRELMEKDLAAVEDRLEQLGGPWTPGRLPRWQENR